MNEKPSRNEWAHTTGIIGDCDHCAAKDVPLIHEVHPFVLMETSYWCRECFNRSILES